MNFAGKKCSEALRGNEAFYAGVSILFRFLLCTFLLLAIILSAAAQSASKDVGLRFLIHCEGSSSVNASNYSKFMRITNYDDVDGENDNLSVIIFFNLTETDKNHVQVYYWNATKAINSYSETGMGTLALKEDSDYVFCANVVPLNFFDYSQENNILCENISTKSEFGNSSGNVSVNASVNASLNVNTSANVSVNVSVNASANTSANIIEIIQNITEVQNPNASNISLNISENFSENFSGNLSGNFSDGILDNISGGILFNSSGNNSEHSENNSVADDANSADNYQDACSCALSITTERDIFADSEKVKFRIHDCQNSTSFLRPVEYWIDDSQKTVKPALNTTSKAEKSFTPNIDAQEKYFLIKARISGCENVTSKLFVAVMQKEALEENSFMKITSEKSAEISEDDDVIYFDIEGNKQNSEKSLISVVLKKSGKVFSETAKMYVPGKNVKYHFRLPLAVDANEIGDGEYTLFAEGIDEEASFQIYINSQDGESKSLKNDSSKIAFDAQENENEDKDSTGEAGAIISFYSRKQIFEPNITVFVSISNPQNKSLLLVSQAGANRFFGLSEKNAFNVSIASPNETIYAVLLDENGIAGGRELALNLSDENLTSDSASDKYGSTFRNNFPSKNPGANVSFLVNSFRNMSMEMSTESTNESDGDADLISGKAAFVPIRLKPGNLLFAAGAIAVCSILFIPKARRFLFKKTKLFK